MATLEVELSFKCHYELSFYFKFYISPALHVPPSGNFELISLSNSGNRFILQELACGTEVSIVIPTIVVNRW